MAAAKLTTSAASQRAFTLSIRLDAAAGDDESVVGSENAGSVEFTKPVPV